MSNRQNGDVMFKNKNKLRVKIVKGFFYEEFPYNSFLRGDV